MAGRRLGLAVLAVVSFLVLLSGHRAMAADRLVIRTASGAHAFTVEVATTMEQQRMGLMYRRALAPDAGMLFPYGAEQEITMWMRNTFIPLDMIFLRRDGSVTRIERDTEPFSERVIASQGPAFAVLEVNAGTALRLGIREGDRAEHPLFAPSDVRPR